MPHRDGKYGKLPTLRFRLGAALETMLDKDWPLPMLPATDTDWVVLRAKELGFDLCGVAPAEAFPELAHMDEWLARGYAGEMRYLHDPRRADPARVLPDAKSVVVCGVNYKTGHPYSTEASATAAAGNDARGWISRYAWGDDYHKALEEKLDQLAAALAARFGGDFPVRAYVDTGPIAERVAARHAGLGWLAKNTCLINEEIGSWLFLGVIVTSLALSASTDAVRPPAPDLCGNCRLCLDACPTGALVEPYVMDARRCIAYLTIELRDTIPEEFRAPMGWQVFGCDICQDVCPWNRAAAATSVAVFEPREKLVAPELAWLLSLEEEEFRQIFRASPVRRTKWRGLIRNACIAAGNALAKINRPGTSPDTLADTPEATRLRGQLLQLSRSDDIIIAEHARWALAQHARGAAHVAE